MGPIELIGTLEQELIEIWLNLPITRTSILESVSAQFPFDSGVRVPLKCLGRPPSGPEAHGPSDIVEPEQATSSCCPSLSQMQVLR